MEIWRGFKRAWGISETSMKIPLNYIPGCLALLKKYEVYCLGTGGGDILKDHFTSLEQGLEFLEFFLDVSTNEDFKQCIRDLVTNMKQKLDILTFEQEDHRTDNTNLDQAYAALRGDMKSVVINPGTYGECDTLFPKIFTVMSDFRKANDFLLEKLEKLLTSNCEACQIAVLMKELKDLLKMMMSLKPLYIYVSGFHCLYMKVEEEELLATLTALLDITTHLIYLSSVGKMDEEMVLFLKKNFSKLRGFDIREIYLMTLNIGLSGPFYHENYPYRLNNLIRLLQSNDLSLNDANAKLYGELSHIRTFLSGLKESVRRKKNHYLQASFEAILGQAISVICLCCDDHSEDNKELNSILSDIFNRIQHIKSEALDIKKLYYYPRTDGFGFLEFFSGYLKEIGERRKISTKLKNVIATLHFEVYSLISLLKASTQEKLNEALWTRIIQLAYQAEYVVDLSVGRVPINRSSHISSLCKIVEQLKPIREEVKAISDKILPAEDVDSISLGCQVFGTASSVNNNGVVVGFHKDVPTIMEYLLGGEKELDVISIVGMPGIGKTTLALSLYKTPQIAHHFDILAWCTVSQSYQKRDLLLRILDQANQLDDNTKHLDDQGLADHLCRRLRKHRYLIILDDIWDTVAWNYLKKYLRDDMQGSRVLVTTRYQAVALEIKSKAHELHELTKEESWELLQKKLVNKGTLSESLVNIGYAIAENCKGLPLSVVVIAGLLSDVEKTEEKWNEIAESVTSLVLDDPQGKCRAILELSYNHLPHHLRACFLYFGVYLEDQEISVTHLMRLWIVEGLVRATESKSAEEVAEKYMEDLIV